jgi:hypothetical protein
MSNERAVLDFGEVAFDQSFLAQRFQKIGRDGCADGGDAFTDAVRARRAYTNCVDARYPQSKLHGRVDGRDAVSVAQRGERFSPGEQVLVGVIVRINRPAIDSAAAGEETNM